MATKEIGIRDYRHFCRELRIIVVIQMKWYIFFICVILEKFRVLFFLLSFCCHNL